MGRQRKNFVVYVQTSARLVVMNVLNMTTNIVKNVQRHVTNVQKNVEVWQVLQHDSKSCLGSFFLNFVP